MPILVYDGNLLNVKTRYGIFSRGQPQQVTEEVAHWLSMTLDFTQLVGIKFVGKEHSRSLRLTNGKVIALPKDETRLVPIAVVYKLKRLPEFTFVPEEELLRGFSIPIASCKRIPNSLLRAPIVDTSPLGTRLDGSHGSISSVPKEKYRLGVFTARPQGYVSGGYYHVWMTANALCSFFDVTLVCPAMPREYTKLMQHPELKIILDSNYLLDLGYSSFDMVMSLHGTCGERATSYATRYNIPVYLHCFEPGNLVKAKQPGSHFSETAWNYRREMYKRVDYIICSNTFTQQWTKEWLEIDPRKVVACVPPLNFAVADKVPEQEEKHEIVFISRMIDYKRPLDVLEIAIRVDKTLVVNYIGAHSRLNKKILEVARREGVTVNFYDGISEEEKFEIIKRCKFMVFPTAFEGYGLPPAEALYCKKPCLAYDIPVLKNNYEDMLEFVHDRDSFALCAKASQLLKDPEYRKRRGEQGRAFIKDRLSFEACENSYIPIMPPTRISFLVIVFEGGDYLEECLKQIYPHAWEILVAEGAVHLMAARKGYFESRDKTLEILQHFPDPEKKIRVFRIDNRPWKDKAEMKSVLLKASTGHILWQVDSDEFYKHEDIDKVVQAFIDDASLDLIDVYSYHFWGDYTHYRVDSKWGQCKFTRIWRKRGKLEWTYHDCPHRDGKPYRGTNFKGLKIGRINYHYGYVRSEEAIEDKIEFLASRDSERANAYRKEFEEWKKKTGADIRVFEGAHPEEIAKKLKHAKQSVSTNNRRSLALST